MNNDYGSQEIFYDKFYQSVIFGGGLGPKAVRRTHQSMESPFANMKFDKVLEIGGGVGEHLDFVLHEYNEYFLTDLRKPKLSSPWSNNSKIVCQEANAEALPFLDNTFDRVIATCLMHHVNYPEKVFEEIQRVMKPNGVATIFLTCDPGIMVRSLRALTTAKRAKKLGFEGYKLMVARDHRNHVGSLLEMAKFVFRSKNIGIKYYPFRIPTWNLNGYLIIQVRPLNLPGL